MTVPFKRDRRGAAKLFDGIFDGIPKIHINEKLLTVRVVADGSNPSASLTSGGTRGHIRGHFQYHPNGCPQNATDRYYNPHH